MAEFWLRYDDFKGGDWGLRDPARVDADMFSGNNVVMYDSGLIGPRAGFKKLPVTGLPDHPIVPGPMGFAVWNTNLLIVLNKVWQVPMAGGAASAWAPYPINAVTPVKFTAFNQIMFSLLDGVLYKHQGAASTTAITTPAPLSFITRWNYWLVGVDRNRPWRLWFSKLDDTGSSPDVWPVNNYFDVGNNDPITALVPTYNMLNVGKREGWWTVSGVLGTNESVRDSVIGNGPISPRFTSVTTDNRIIYWPNEMIPAWYNGERVSLDLDHRMPDRSLPYTCDAVVVTPTSRRLFLAGDTPNGTDLWTWKNYVWTHYSSEDRLGGFVPTDVRAGSDLPEHVIYGVRRPISIGDPVVISTLHHELGRPGHADDQYASPFDVDKGQMIQSSLTLPAWYDTQARQVTVRSVVIQFKKWASGSAGTFNRIRMQVVGLGPYGRGREPGAEKVWTEPCEQSAKTGTDDSWRVNIGEQGPANGFLVRFPQVTGIAIREVMVGVTVRGDRT